MTAVPRPALILGLAGLLPFLWGALTLVVPVLHATTVELAGPRLAGSALLAGWGLVILCYMAGVLWGLAAAAGARGTAPWALAVAPALWAFLFAGGGGTAALSALMVGFLALVVVELQFGRWGLTPAWWMRLRLPLTAVVLACLALGAFG